ncbi:MAG: NADH-quinone oxidoreductase subunit K [Bdellovibrionales bacterium RIFOXYD1_FULL_53_11]|nr:MAG: NADH-quinone oxidoreductase subunit K [Bdellovibrionales bacterium RIFOXYD1_FULL_53_11]
MNPGLQHFLVLSAALFACGLLCLVTRRNAIGLLMGIELIINAANINFVAFSRHLGNDRAGQVFALFGIALAAVGVTVALAIVFALYRNFNKSIDVDDASRLRG